MRIFYASDTTPNSAFQSNLWRNNLLVPLMELGHDVIEFNFDLRKTFQNLNHDDPIQRNFIKKNRTIVTKELLKQIRAAHAIKPIDLFFSYFYDACILPEAVDEIRSMGIKTVNWYCNGSYQLHLVKEISPRYDWCLVPEKFRLKDYIAMGARPIYCQEAANPNIYKPYDLPKEYLVTFIGQAYGERPYYIKYLTEKGIDVRVWGFGWERYSQDAIISNKLSTFNKILKISRKLLTIDGWKVVGRRLKSSLNLLCCEKNNADDNKITLPEGIISGVLSDIDMIKMYSRSKINLGFSSCGETHKSGKRTLQIRLRDFEVPMSGGFYMVEYMEELEEFFGIGKEIVCYTGPEDLVDKISYYLKHDSERERIRLAGYQRCLREHTWHKRFEMVFKEMGLL